METLGTKIYPYDRTSKFEGIEAKHLCNVRQIFRKKETVKICVQSNSRSVVTSSRNRPPEPEPVPDTWSVGTIENADRRRAGSGREKKMTLTESGLEQAIYFLLRDQFFKMLKVSQSMQCIWNLL